MDKTRVAFIGTGGIAAVHMAGYKAIPQRAEVTAVCDIDGDKAQKFAEKHGVASDRVYTDFREMLRRPDIDAVSVCTWNAAHAPAAIAALEAGKHVLCEKPMAMNTAEALAMEAAAQKAGKLLMIGFVRRYGNDCAVVRSLLPQVGEIYYAKASYLRRHGFPGGWFGDKRYSGGGPLIDLGVHVIDLARYLMGNPQPVSVYGACFDKLGCRPDLKSAKGEYQSTSADPRFAYNVEDLATAMIRFDNGAVLAVEASFDLHIKDNAGRIDLYGTTGGVSITPQVELTTTLGGYLVDTKPYGDTSLSFTGLFENEIAHFIDCVADGIPCRSPAADGVAVMRILEAVYASAASGHEVVIG